MRRGFKTEANDIAREIRRELGLGLADPLNPWRLAEHLEIPVVELSQFNEVVPDCVHQFTRVAPADFSAVTVFSGPERLIVHNDSHSAGRQASDLAHELSHALLFHSPSPALDHRGCRHWDSELENEATWLSGALLISEEAALWIVRRGMMLEDAADHYGVSVDMVRYRTNVTGARKRVRGWSR